jgi:hypothetical protein
MKVQPESSRTNPFPCGPEEEAANWQQISENFLYIETIINNLDEVYQVMVTEDDSTPSYLHGAWHTDSQGTRTVTRDPLVKFETIGAADTDQTEKAWIDTASISGYVNTGTFVPTLQTDVYAFTTLANFVDLFFTALTLATGLSYNSSTNTLTEDGKVLCSSGDTTRQYLHAKFKDSFTYESEDILVKADLVDDGGDENVRLAIEADSITDYSATGDWVLGWNDGVPTAFDASALGGGGTVTAGTYIDVSGSTVNVDLTEVSGYSSGATQLLGHVSGTFQFKTMAQWLETLIGYDGGQDQSVGHNNGGGPTWQEDASCS